MSENLNQSSNNKPTTTSNTLTSSNNTGSAPSLTARKKLDNESFIQSLNNEESLFENKDMIYKKKPSCVVIKKSSIIIKTIEAKPFTKYLVSDTIVGALKDDKDERLVLISCCIIKTPEPEVRRRKLLKLLFKSVEDSNSFINAIEQHILEKLPGGSPKKRRVRVILNPKSGKKASETIFKEVSALFKDAQVFLKKSTTKGPEHAKQIGFKFDYNKYDTIVFISGDGLFHEFINGLLARDDWLQAKKVSLALIPAGTGNGLACSIGLADPMSAALAVIRGYSRPLDISVVEQGGMKWCSILSLTWGIISDVDIESEKYRYLGPLRLQIGAAIRILMLRVYKGKILFQPSVESTKETLSKIPKCSYECEICISNKPDQLINSYVNNTPIENDNNNNNNNNNEEDIKVNLNINMNGFDSPKSTGEQDLSSSNSNKELSSSSSKKSKTTFEKVEIPLAKIPTIDLLNKSEGELLNEGWKILDGEFIGVVASTVSHLAPDFISSPTAHLNDGNIDLVIINHPDNFSKTDLLSVLTESSTGKHLESHIVEHYKVKSLILEPGQNKEGIIAIDGERINYGRTSMECIRGCINLTCRSY